MNDLIPFSRVIERVRKLANDYPERKAECEYFNMSGTPQCIWGHVFAELGCSTKYDESREVWWVVNASGDRVTEAGSSLNEDHPDWGALGVEHPNADQQAWSEMVQQEQDTPLAWGFAVGSVDEDFKRCGITV
ncbi:hypothetical protein [Mycobacteroides immunogenum]|uniref:Uncharacterized protein n=1 Tax=Mycobacteroides immunogenum TaxID=83262 RepID=A0A7V8LQZ2_9MYCO|nr:hypothetical protein [Mycobacteroides immunogenum]KPG13708.1 hypothetical protein AN909_05435 [Mycobacteroides immunogenum]KPG14303.1 hypothetical protein AN908_06970 [Mycobacteroides immunogenum]KPG14371.1 hypothetical protein AN908_07425 [Mycobacteroides immunogenum]KPG17422.1 hypothetical protein AN910_04660 [Mycobacteroides immunogenum]KPG23994.1 hypothetical protein AN911_00500 [Mycobacteroides immunogenum]